MMDNKTVELKVTKNKILYSVLADVTYTISHEYRPFRVTHITFEHLSIPNWAAFLQDDLEQYFEVNSAILETCSYYGEKLTINL